MDLLLEWLNCKQIVVRKNEGAMFFSKDFVLEKFLQIIKKLPKSLPAGF